MNLKRGFVKKKIMCLYHHIKTNIYLQYGNYFLNIF